MENELSRPLTKYDLVSYEKLKIKWKELSVEVKIEKIILKFYFSLNSNENFILKDIILDALYINSIRLVREYFEKVLKMDLKPNKIKDIGLKSVLQLLADKDLRSAETLLNHMVRLKLYQVIIFNNLNVKYFNFKNFDFNQKIYQICFFTPYKQLRDYLVNFLIEKKKLNEYEIDIINYLKKLETYYACRSYALAKKSIPVYK